MQLLRAVCETKPTAPSAAVARIEAKALSNFGDGVCSDDLRRDLQGDLDWILMTALRKDPERRYASAEHFADDLRRHLDGLPVLARPDRLSYRASKFVRRNRMAVAAAAVANSRSHEMMIEVSSPPE